MKSPLPKVLHEVCGRPMLAYVLDACRSAGADRLICVIGHEAAMVRRAFADQSDVCWVEQTEQLGTGHAVMVCRDRLEGLTGPVLVLAGDGPLVRGRTLRALLEAHRAAGAACTLGTCVMDDPGANGRILRDQTGNLLGVVEYLDATQAQRQIREVNVSLYCFDAPALRLALGQLRNDNAKGEYYLTDVPEIIRRAGLPVSAAPAMPAEEVLSVNDREQLARVEELMRRRRECDCEARYG